MLSHLLRRLMLKTAQGARENRTLLVTIMAFFCLNIIWFYWIFGSYSEILICCDAVNSIRSANIFADKGWSAVLPYEGYRSISGFAFIHGVRSIGALFVDAGQSRFIDTPYAVGATLSYGITGLLFVGMFRRYKGFFPAFSGVFLNPVSMGVLPTPLQESQMVLIVAPLLLASYLFIRNSHPKMAIITMAALSGAAWMVKPSFLIAVLGCWVIIAYLVVCSRQKKEAALTACAGFALFILIVSPQINLSLDRFGTLYPYPENGVLFDQFSWGNEMWHYETGVFRDGDKISIEERKFGTPYSHVEPREYISYLIENPMIAASLAGGHIIGAFDYANLQTYVPSRLKETFSPFNILVGFVMFSALFNWARRIGAKDYGTDDAILDLFLFATMAPLVIVAAETRFSLFPMLIMSVRCVMWMRAPLSRSDRFTETIISAVFGLFFASAVSIMAGTRLSGLL